MDILLGLQWGDEGKGKIVDVLTPDYDIIARFQGGPNAGHSLEFNKIKHVLHSIPSGIFHKDKINIIGNGVVIDPIIFKSEIDTIKKLNLDIDLGNLLISKRAHLILPTHRILDAASEASKGHTKIGSTLKGIGPTYMDKTGRNGLRVGDVLRPDFQDKYNFLTNKHLEMLKSFKFDFDLAEFEKGWFEGIELIKTFKLVDSEIVINDYLNENKTIIAEGAQGTMLDIDFGSYPYVTSSNTVCAGACAGLGVAPNKVNEVFGIFKAYCTRVGSGPFPTELTDETGEKLRDLGHEFGATTGRARRCGWLDLPELKYAIMLNGVTQLIMTKADVLSGFDTIKVCTAYKIGNQTYKTIPYDLDVEDLQPEYAELKGWKTDICNMTKISELPKELIDFINFIEKEIDIPIKVVSVGPDRNQTIVKG